jgi:hypothetical protein
LSRSFVSVKGTAALAHTWSGYFLCAAAVSSFHIMAASLPSSGEVRETDRNVTQRTHHADLMAETIHLFGLAVEVEPFSPGAQRRPSLMDHVIVSTEAVAVSTGIAAALVQPAG